MEDVMKKLFIIVLTMACLVISSNMVFAERFSGYIVTKDGKTIVAHEFPVCPFGRVA